MRIDLVNAGKRFNREWIFRGVSLSFSSGAAYAITGPNGSGKSTLLQSIGGMLQLSEGSIAFNNGKSLPNEKVYNHLSFCAPYMDLIEEMTLEEFLDFHAAFKPLLDGFSTRKAIETIGLESAAQKQIRNYSSGMQQRVKLAQAIFSNTEVVLLDEPCSNLDRQGIELYHSLISRFCANRLLIICSNDPEEYSSAKEVHSIMDYKNN